MAIKAGLTQQPKDILNWIHHAESTGVVKDGSISKISVYYIHPHKFKLKITLNHVEHRKLNNI